MRARLFWGARVFSLNNFIRAKRRTLSTSPGRPALAVERGSCWEVLDHSITLSVSLALVAVIMSTLEDNDRSTLSTNIYIPVSSDKTALSWDNNDATILGLLFECGKHYKNKGLFQMLLRHRAVALNNGRLAVEDPNAVYFLSGIIAEAHDFDDPCPPTPQRIDLHNFEVARGARVGSTETVLNTLPEEYKDTIIVAKHCVEAEDSKLLHSLSYVFGYCESSDSMLEMADGTTRGRVRDAEGAAALAGMSVARTRTGSAA